MACKSTKKKRNKKRRAYRLRPGLIGAALALGVTYGHLRRCLLGERVSRRLLEDYQKWRSEQKGSNKVKKLSLSLLLFVAFCSSAIAQTYRSMCDSNMPPSPFNWCEDCATYDQGDGDILVDDCLLSWNPSGGFTLNVPDPGDGGDTNNVPVTNGFWLYITGLDCPGNNYPAGTNHPSNLAPIAWQIDCPHGFTPIWDRWHDWVTVHPGDHVNILQHDACTNHPADWTNLQLIAVLETNAVWFTNYWNIKWPHGNVYATAQVADIPTNSIDTNCFLCDWTNCVICYDCVTNIAQPCPPYTNILTQLMIREHEPNDWDFELLDNPPGPIRWPWSGGGIGVPKEGNLYVRGVPGTWCSAQGTPSLSSPNWITISKSNIYIGLEGTNAIWCTGSNVISTLGLTTNDILPAFYFRLKREN